MPVAIELTKRVYLEKLTEELYEDLEYFGQLDSRFYVYRDAVYSTARNEWVYVVDTEKDKLAVECPLTKRKRQGTICYHPDYTKTDSRYRGKALALRLYAFLIKSGMTLQAGDSQSVGSQKLWAKLTQMKGIEVWSQRNKKWAECFVCDVTDRIDTMDWDPYEVNCLTIAHN
jgi:hypothetical protein